MIPMKFRSSIFLGLFFLVGAQAPITGCAPADNTDGSGGATSAGGAGVGGLFNGAGGSSSGGSGTGGSGTGGVAASSGGASIGSGGVGIGGTAPELTWGTGAGGTSPEQPATFATFQAVIYGKGCDSSDCHGLHADLVLKGTPDEVYEHLLGTVSEECGGLTVLVPGDPDASALVRLLKGACGSLPQMPADCDCDPVPYINNCVPADYVMAVEEWVRIGAPK